MKRYMISDPDKELFRRAKAIASKIHRLEEQFDPFCDTYEKRPSITKVANEIVNDIKSGKTVDDFSYAYGVREFLKDEQRYSSKTELIAELESVYNDLIALYENN